MTGDPQTGPAEPPQAPDLQVLADDADLQVPIDVSDPEIEPQDQVPAAEAASASPEGSLAARMRAHMADIAAAADEEFPVPGWGRDLLIRVRYLTRDEWEEMTAGPVAGADLIVRCTVALRLRGDDGEYEDVPGAFGPELAGILSLPETTPPARLVAALMADRIGYIGTLAQGVLAWQRGQTAQVAEALGE